MRRLTFCIGLLLPALAFGQRDRDSRSWRVEEQDSIRQSFAFNGNDGRRLLVDNVSGFDHETGYAGSTVQVSVAKRIREVNDTAA